MAFDSVQMTSSVRTLALQGEIISADAGEKIWSARREIKIRLVSLLGMFMEHETVTCTDATSHRGAAEWVVHGAHSPAGLASGTGYD